MHTDLRHFSPFIPKFESNIFTYLRQLAFDYQLKNIKFFSTVDQDDCICSLITFGDDISTGLVSNRDSILSYFTVMQEQDSTLAQPNWMLVDCNNMKIEGLCDLIFSVFQVLKNDFDIVTPSVQPEGDLCFVGFGEIVISQGHHKNSIHKLTMAMHFFEKLMGVMSLSNQPKNKITPRELECIGWVGKGKTSGEIGSILAISERTVDKHIAAVCRKLNAVNRMQMMVKAVRLGLI